ncbi:MAG: Gfo/Idh/MocA family oxidoreductase [Anaerolineales bacterium]|nr:Gfo/Idh/MocA family oxidoreductase [Anaerolineales bacterium]
MKQLSQNLRTGKLTIEEVPVPAVQPGWVLVQSAYSLISAGTERSRVETGKKSLLGKALARPDQVRQVLDSVKKTGLKTTLEKVRTKLDARSPLGYSAAGVVIASGAGVEDFRTGDWVACGGASAAHGEAMLVPRNLCVRVPAGVGLDQAAFTTVGAIALQGLRQADLRLGEVGVVMGLGLLGQLTVQLLKAAGCAVVGYDPDAQRCELARELGAEAAVAEEAALLVALSGVSAGKGADAVLITAGTSSNRPVELAGEITREKGKVVVVGAVGLTLPREPYYHKELDLRLSRSYGPGRYDAVYEDKGQDYPYGYVRWTEKRNMEAFIALVGQGKVNLTPLITHRFKLEQASEAYALLSGKPAQPALGVLFAYDTAPLATGRVSIHPSPQAPTARVQIGVIGAGNFAQSRLLPHLKNHPHAALHSLANRTPLATRDAAERFGIGTACSTPEEIFNDPAVRAVLITTRHDSHAHLATQALHAGKAIHLEKPLVLTPAELEMVTTAYQTQPHAFLMVGFNRRFAPLVQEMSRFFAGRREPLAMLYRVNAGYLPLDHWTQDPAQGGRVIGEACHFIDLFQYFAGARPTQVVSLALPNLGKYRDDNLSISLSFADGSVGTIMYVANGDKAVPKEYLEVSGEGKTAILTDYRHLALMAGGRTRTFKQAQDKGHRAEMLAWVEALRTGQGEPLPFVDAVQTTQASFAAMQSLAEGKVIAL